MNEARREKTQALAELRDIDSKIPSLESRLSKDKVELVTSKQARRSSLLVQKSRLVELGEQLGNASQFISEDISRFNQYVSQINSLLREVGIEISVTVLDYTPTVSIEVIRKLVESELSQVVAGIEASEKELRGYEVEMQEHARYLSRKNELSSKLATISTKLETIANDNQQLNTEREERDKLFRELLLTIVQQQQKYSEIITIFGSQKAEVLSDLDFKDDIQFANSELLTGLQDVLDNRQVEVMAKDGTVSEFQQLQDLYSSIIAGDTNKIDSLGDETTRLSEDMKKKIKKSQAITPGNLYRCLYGTYLSVVPVVTYKRTALSKLSLGHKATVLIKIYLAQGTNPIIIDSHDDHLDNEFIVEELVGAIRKAKTYRQVILASNNGNVVINSDAEQIIIAQRDQGKISYIAGAIENPVIRDRALKVLEGGADAFKKRQEKYRLDS